MLFGFTITCLAAAVAAEQPMPMYGRLVARSSLDTFGLLAVRQSECDPGTIACDSYCMPIGSNCCHDGNGGFCTAAEVCGSGGCCPIGETCSGPPTSCDAGLTLCYSYCIQSDAICCGANGFSCAVGESCGTDQACLPGGQGTPGQGSAAPSNPPPPPATSSPAPPPPPASEPSSLPSSTAAQVTDSSSATGGNDFTGPSSPTTAASNGNGNSGNGNSGNGNGNGNGNSNGPVAAAGSGLMPPALLALVALVAGAL